MKAILMAIVLTASFSAQANKLTRTVKKLEKKLGMEISFETTNTDNCTKEQLVTFLNDYRSGNKAFKAEAKAKLEGKSLMVNKASLKGTIKGQMIFMQLITYYSNNGDWNHIPLNSMIVAEKVVADKRENLNVFTMNEVIVGGAHIDMNLSKVENNYTRKYYQTVSNRLYNFVKDEETLKEALLDGFLSRPHIYQAGVDFEKVSCGTISLKDLMKKL